MPVSVMNGTEKSHQKYQGSDKHLVTKAESYGEVRFHCHFTFITAANGSQAKLPSGSPLILPG